MDKIGKILYLEDQQDMKDGIEPHFELTEFSIEFSNFKSQEKLKEKIIQMCPLAVIADDDLGGQSYTDEIANAVKDARLEKNSKILLVGCSAYANAKGIEPEYKKIGFDRFFDNEGLPEQLDEIINYIRKNVKN